MDIRLSTALILGKITAYLLKLKGSGATAAPGLYALNIDPDLVKKLSFKNNLKTIVVTGTNGKTTTSRLIYDILKNKHKIIHNRAGSNLLRGVASTLINNSSISGKINADLAILEADEAALVPISKNININILVLLNLFRDQLDRYGEIDTTRKKWIEVVKKLDANSTIIINSDDPSTNYLAKFSKAKNIFFGIDEKNLAIPVVENVADVKYCINCGYKLNYKKLYSAHLGIYSCEKCTFERNTPEVAATNIKLNRDFSSHFKIRLKSKTFDSAPKLPGLFNVYNVLAAVSCAMIFNIDPKSAIAKFEPVFGRFEKITLKNKQITTMLIKNPAGSNEVIRTLLTQDRLDLLIVLNDNVADGRDVSWIWDTNWEALNNKVGKIFISGKRAYDLALRLKYANLNTKNLVVEPDILSALKNSIGSTNDLIILPTYTAMLELQKYLGSRWHKQ